MTEQVSKIHDLSNTEQSIVKSTTWEPKKHDIPDFLKRVYTIDNFEWKKTDAAGSVLKTYRFPEALLSQPPISKKVSNFFGLRAGVELIVLVNKQQFQCGNLMISYLPGAKYNPSKAACCEQQPGTYLNLPTLTGMPRCNLDLMDATKAVLKVPYVSPFVYYNLLTGDGTIGDFYLSVYSMLSDIADSGTVSVQVMARFVDVELDFPSGNPILSHLALPELSSKIEEMQLDKAKNRLVHLNALEKLVENAKAPYKLQMNDTDIETKNFKPKALPNMAVANESNNTHLISISKDNHLPSTNTGEASKDEMSFTEIVKIPCYFDRFRIENTTAGGTNVWNTQVKLTDFRNVSGHECAVDYITYIGQGFSKWRSSFNFHFRFVKTTFHSLRVRIFFAPGASTDLNIDRNACLSKIIDLKDNNFAEFTVPFVWPQPFLNTDNQAGQHGPISLGVLGVDVLTKMVNPATVSSSIEVIVERSAAPDFCVNLPRELTYFPIDPRPASSENPEDGSYDGEQQWQRDLTEEGIEPNPGPTSWVFIEKTTPPSWKSNIPIGSVIDSVQLSFSIADEWVLFAMDGPTTVVVYEHAGTTQMIVPCHNFVADDTFHCTISGPASSCIVAVCVNWHNPVTLLSDMESFPNVPVGSEWQRDLTMEGIESNPGPVWSRKITANVVPNFPDGSGFQVGSKIIGLQLSYVSPGGSNFTLVVSGAWNFSVIIPGNTTTFYMPMFEEIPTGAIQFQLSSGQFFIDGFIQLLIETPYTRTGIVNTQLSAQGIIDQTEAGKQVADYANTLDWTIAQEEGTEDKAYAVTTSGDLQAWAFQMNSEQDEYREHNCDVTFERPESSRRVDSLVLGNSITSVKQMMQKASVVSRNLPVSKMVLYLVPHAIGTTQGETISGVDSLSYYAHLYAFARGGVDIKIINVPDFGYSVILDPDGYLLSSSDGKVLGELSDSVTDAKAYRMLSNLSQTIKPSMEGYGDLTIPYYASSYMYYVNPVVSRNVKTACANLQLPSTSCVIVPYGKFTSLTVYRSVRNDFELSMLTGPPRLNTQI